MIKNYFITSLRNIQRQKVYSLINVTGLAVGITCCLLIFLFIRFELSFDDFHPNADNIYRVTSYTVYPSGKDYRGATPYPLASALRNDFPELEHVTCVFYEFEGVISLDDERYKEHGIVFTDPEFFEIFQYKWVSGDPETALNEPNSVLLTEGIARKYFGDIFAMGRHLNLDNNLDLKVTGILEDPPVNTNLPFTMIISLASLKDYLNEDYDRWNITYASNMTYVLLPEYYSPGQLEAQFDDFKKKYLAPDNAEVEFFSLQPLREIHFDAKYGSFSYTTSKIYIWVFSLIGFLILSIACINFVNLATAQATRRSKEVGIRKTLGARRIQLIRQFMGESVFFTLAAVLVSLMLTEMLIPGFNQLFRDEIVLDIRDVLPITLFLAMISAVVCLMTGMYPAIVLSACNPVQALQDKITSPNRSSFTLRSVLVVIQFSISQILIISTIVISGQMEYFRNKELGYESNGIVTVNIPDPDESKLEVLRNRLLQNPRIENLTSSFGAPTTNSIMQTHFHPIGSGQEKEYQVIFKPADSHYSETFTLELLSGRWLQPHIEDDSSYTYVVNSTLVNKIGVKNPEDAIGKLITVSNFTGEIIGVVKDFHMFPLHDEIMPAVLVNFLPRFFREVDIKINTQNTEETLNYIKTVWEGVFPEYMFEYEFLDDYLAGLYERENRTLSLIKMFTIIAILLSCLGLAGLVSLMIVQRTKEVGIRKVLGASLSDIVFTISKDFLVMVIVANIIAWPVSYYAMNKWLENFAYRIDMGILPFAISAAITLIIALITVSYQAIRAARANPVDSLQYE